MKSVIAGTVTVTAGLFAANMLGVAIAETTTVPPTRTISVQGIANVPIPQHDSAEAATAVYRQAMAAAVLDGQGKAAFLAEKTATMLGGAQSVIEGGGYINCSSEGEYAEYEGGQPDFGSGPQPVGVVAPAASAAPTVRRAKTRRTKRRRTVAKKATAASCTLSAQVALVYAIS
ncbi:MAG: hypothetical protein H0X28_01235 [Solirubrobacterales bacterium]|nr:hypothetical protein [Solirubrobacterales bacterium]